MATLIAVYNSDGCVGRCDATCYNAKHKKCTCICGGKNHGVGQYQAEWNIMRGGRELGLHEPDAGFLERHKLEPDGKDWKLVNRLIHPDARKARVEARTMINQYDLWPWPKAG
jgi:hypothetical protein